MMRRSHSAALTNRPIKGRTLFAALASGFLLLAFMAQPVVAAEPSPSQATAKPTQAQAKTQQKHKAHRTSKAKGSANAPRPDTQGPLSLVVVGDIMLEDGPMDAMRKGQDPFAGFASLFAGADIRIGNFAAQNH